MLPLAGSEVTRNSGDEANLILAACIVAPQLVVAAISPWIGRLAEQLSARPAAPFYQAVGAFLQAFAEVEAQGFDMAE